MDFFVAFFDASESEVIASFSCKQDAKVWPHQGVVSDADNRWLSYIGQFPDGTFKD